MAPSETTIGWIGAGKMGLPICHRFKEKGYQVRVLGRNPAALQSLTSAGFIACRTVAEVATKSNIVFSSVTDDAALSDVVSNVTSNLAAGNIFVDISTVSPEISATIAKTLQAKSIHYLRSPVSGSTALAASGTLTAVVSGPKSIFDRLEPVFAAFTRKAFHVGEAEEARYLKLVLNSMVAATSALLGEALAFGRKGGLTHETMLDVITQSVVASPLIGYKKDMIISGDYKPAATLNMLKKDLDLLLSAGQKQNVPLPVNTMIRKIYEAAGLKGLGEKDFFVLVQEAETAAGLSAESK
jgi:3-hydroxyisobutyrate dehydrogenase-like beta-hydroxyacid dehydrogenase